MRWYVVRQERPDAVRLFYTGSGTTFSSEYPDAQDYARRVAYVTADRLRTHGLLCQVVSQDEIDGKDAR